jgi:hypothetical protein
MEGQDSNGSTDPRPPSLRLKLGKDASCLTLTEPQQNRGVASNTARVHPIKAEEDVKVSQTATYLPMMKKLEEKTTPDKVGQSKLKDLLPPNYTGSKCRSNSHHYPGFRVWNKEVQAGIDRDKAVLLTKLEQDPKSGVVTSSHKSNYITVSKQAVADSMLVKEVLTTGQDLFEKRLLSHTGINGVVSCCISPIERNVLFSNKKPSPEVNATWITKKHGTWQKAEHSSTKKESTLGTSTVSLVLPNSTVSAMSLVLPNSNVSTFVSSDICTFTNTCKHYASVIDRSTMKAEQLLIEKFVKPISSKKMISTDSVAKVEPVSIGKQESTELLNNFVYEVRCLANRSMDGLTDNQQKVFRIAVQDLINVIRQMQLTNCVLRVPVGKHVACPTYPHLSTLVEEFPKAMVDKEPEEVILPRPKPLLSKKQKLRCIDGISRLVELSSPSGWSYFKTMENAGVQLSMDKKGHTNSTTAVGRRTVDSDEIEVIKIIPPPGNSKQGSPMENISTNNEILCEMESVGWTDEELVNLIIDKTHND